MQQSAASSSKGDNTVYNSLNRLYASQSSLTPALPYLHPYAPLKGKSRALDVSEQVEILTQLKVTIDEARICLNDPTMKDESKVKLMRALKDVSTHQQALLPTATSLSGYTPSVHRTSLPPLQLIQQLAQSLGMQHYQEDSQFGLLKTSLTLAGQCFVVDLDLENDAVAGKEDEDDTENPPSGGVRLNKISASHAVRDIQGKSEWIESALKGALDGYLDIWNSGDRAQKQGELEGSVRGIDKELRDLMVIDAMAAESDVDWFMEVERISKRLGGDQPTSSGPFYPCNPTVFPSFTLFPAPSPSPRFHLRPARPGEEVYSPIASEDIEEAWLTGRWVLEYISEEGRESDGLVVRRSWLGEEDQYEANWDGLIRIEHLLYRRPDQSLAAPFPYNSEFTHHTTGTMQRWAMAEPGPEAFVIGRVGLPKSVSGLEKLVELLRAQAILNQLFCGIFSPEKLDDGADGADADANVEDLFAEPAAIAITARMSQRSIGATVSLPRPKGQVTLLSITMTPGGDETPVATACQVTSPDEGLQAKVDAAVASVSGEMDAVKIVERILQSVM